MYCLKTQWYYKMELVINQVIIFDLNLLSDLREDYSRLLKKLNILTFKMFNFLPTDVVVYPYYCSVFCKV